MAVKTVIANLTSGSQDGELDERADRTYRVSYFVETDDPKDGPQIVGDAPGLPRLRATYQFGNDRDLGSTLKRITPRRMPGTQTLWEVELEYSSRVEVIDLRADRDPLARPADMSWSTVPYQRVATYDRSGTRITNTAGDAPQEGSLVDDNRLVMTYTRNESAYDIPFVFSFRDCVNSDPFFGFAPGEAKLSRISSERRTENKTEYWETSYEFHFRNTIRTPGSHVLVPAGPGAWNEVDTVPPWNLTLENLGYRELRDGQITKINTQVAWPLDASGAKLEGSWSREDTFLVSFEIYDAKPFAPLGIV